MTTNEILEINEMIVDYVENVLKDKYPEMNVVDRYATIVKAAVNAIVRVCK
jgi:hypothetical protein